MQTVQTMKKLTKIKLINWHYFQNETINVDGSFLLSGENASGKSTILDAIQLVLTTSTKSFNLATTVGEKRSSVTSKDMCAVRPEKKVTPIIALEV